MRRWPLFVLLVLGLTIAGAPVATGMFGKSDAAAQVTRDFKPIMDPAAVKASRQSLEAMKRLEADLGPSTTPESITAFGAYLNVVHLAVAENAATPLAGWLGQVTGTDATSAFLAFAKAYPQTAKLMMQMPAMEAALAGPTNAMTNSSAFLQSWPQVIAGMEFQVSTMERNVDTFASSATLPARALPWIILGVGLVIALLAAVGLLPRHPKEQAEIPAEIKAEEPVTIEEPAEPVPSDRVLVLR